MDDIKLYQANCDLSSRCYSCLGMDASYNRYRPVAINHDEDCIYSKFSNIRAYNFNHASGKNVVTVVYLPEEESGASYMFHSNGEILYSYSFKMHRLDYEKLKSNFPQFNWVEFSSTEGL